MKRIIQKNKDHVRLMNYPNKPTSYQDIISKQMIYTWIRVRV